MKTPAYPMSNPERFSRGVRLMFRTMRPRLDELILPDTQRTDAGDEYLVFRPSGKSVRTAILVYGMSIEGEQDGRLLKFARSCANAGLKVIIPHLPGLMDFIVAPADLERLERILSNLKSENENKMALIGFSTGGSYAMLLAANPELKDKIGPVVLISPIYDARDVAERLHAAADPQPHSAKEWDQFYWAQYVIAYRNRKHLDIPDAVQEALQIFLADYDRYEVEVKGVFYDNYIAPLRLNGRSDLISEGQDLDRLSARGHLAGVESPVFIMHDASDRLVPPEHSRSMHTELALRGANFRQGVLVTPWLSHVVMQKTGSLTELFQFVSYMSELFRETSNTK